MFQNKTSIAILMATYNGEKYIGEQIDSILKQSNQDWCLFINDDGSNDETNTIIRSYQINHPNKIYILEIQPKRLSASGNFNSLLQNVESRYYMFSDQDDIWLPTKIEKLYAEMKKNELEDEKLPIIVHSDMVVVDNNLEQIAASFHDYAKVNPKLSTFNYLGVMNNINGCAMLFNSIAKHISSKLGDLSVHHDWWIAINVSKAGKIVFLNETTLLYRQHESNVVGANKLSLGLYISKIISFKSTLRHDVKHFNHLRSVNYGGPIKYIFYKILFQFKRHN